MPTASSALITARPYKPSLSADEVFSTMKEETERGWRDPELIEEFVSLLQAGGELTGLEKGKPGRPSNGQSVPLS